MAGLTDLIENRLLDHLVGKTAWAMPTVWVALFTTIPADDGTGGVEVSGGSYARKATAGADWAAAAAGASSNANQLAFPVATASWGTVVAVGLFDAATAGNLLAFAGLTANTPVASGDTARFPVGDLDLSAS